MYTSENCIANKTYFFNKISVARVDFCLALPWSTDDPEEGAVYS